MQLKGRNLPLRKQVRLERLIKLNDEIIDYFAEKAVKYLEKHMDTEKGHIGCKYYILKRSYLKFFDKNCDQFEQAFKK